MTVINSLLGDFGRVAMAAAVGAAAAAGVMLAAQSSSSTRSDLLRGALDRKSANPPELGQSIDAERILQKATKQLILHVKEKLLFFWIPTTPVGEGI